VRPVTSSPNPLPRQGREAFACILRARTVFLLLVVLLGCTDIALAWGPATHIELAGSILERLSIMPAAIAAILARNGIAYIYGNIAADIVFAKRWSRVKQSCHHWSTGFGLLENAEDDRAAAFAYGYLSHLAADTVAHGKFVPRQIAVCDSTVNFGHFYWELRADAMQSESTWALLEQIIAGDHSDHHAVMERRITDTFLPYEFNRRLFDRMNAMTVRHSFRRTVHLWGRLSRWDLPVGLMAGYRSECLDRIQSILANGPRSSLLREDPNGTSALMQLSVRRRQVRRMKRIGIPIERTMVEAAVGLAPQSPIVPTLITPLPVDPLNGDSPASKADDIFAVAPCPDAP